MDLCIHAILHEALTANQIKAIFGVDKIADHSDMAGRPPELTLYDAMLLTRHL